MSDVSHVSSAAQLGARRELAMLHRILKAGEQVIDVCHGTAEGRRAVLVLTDARVVSMRQRRLWGTDVESTPLAHVRAAADHMGVRHATVVVDAGGRVIELHEVDGALAQMFCARLRERLAGHGTPSGDAAVVLRTGS